MASLAVAIMGYLVLGARLDQRGGGATDATS